MDIHLNVTVCAYDEKKRTLSFRASDVLRSLRHLYLIYNYL
jgi:hypothetical protein